MGLNEGEEGSREEEEDEGLFLMNVSNLASHASIFLLCLLTCFSRAWSHCFTSSSNLLIFSSAPAFFLAPSSSFFFRDLQKRVELQDVRI